MRTGYSCLLCPKPTSHFPFLIGAVVFLIAAGCNQPSRNGDSHSRNSNSNSKPSEIEFDVASAKPIAQFGNAGTNQNELHSQAMQSRPAAVTETLFTQIDSSDSGVDFVLELPNPEDNIREMLRMPVYGGICTGDYDGDGLIDFLVANPSGSNRLYRNLGNFRFADVTEAVGLHDPDFWGTGATFVDIDNDGDLDIFCCGYRQPNRLFVNLGMDRNGRVSFSEQAKKIGLNQDLASMTMAFADIDNDGDLDGYLATTGRAPESEVKMEVVKSADGQPTIADHLQEVWTVRVKPDGELNISEAGQFDRLLLNNGGSFADISESAGLTGPCFTLSAIWFDYNGDGLPDLYASNDYMGADQLYHNNGGATFSDVVARAMPYTSWFSMGADIGDVNNDGMLDLFTTDMASTTHVRSKLGMGEMSASSWFLDSSFPRQYMRNCLFLNTGMGRMLESSFLSGVAATNWSWSGRMEDYDNDGRIDLVVTNGAFRDGLHSDKTKYADETLGIGTKAWTEFWLNEPMLKERNIAFRNLDGLQFENVAEAWGFDRAGVSFGTATADFDNDGDLDLVVCNADAPVGIYRNNENRHNSIRVRLIGRESNRYGLGATVQIKSGNLTQTKYLTQTRGWLSSSDPSLNFGLGTNEKIDLLTVKWPSGATSRFSDLQANNILTVREPDSSANVVSESLQRKNPQTMFAGQRVKGVIHRERIFDDFERQPLLPNKLSQLGPGIAVGDIDGDGDEDAFFGQGAGTSGQVLINQSGRLLPTTVANRFLDPAQENMGALLFDIEGDGDLDLYTANGGVECEPGDELLRDRLYLNQSNSSRFEAASIDIMPDIRNSSSCVVGGDFDRDGDLDLFVGGRVVPGQYPSTPQSVLLRNDSQEGVPKLVDVTDQLAKGLKDAGMVTAALWSDADGDRDLDLLVCLEWGPIKLFRNDGGILVDATNTTGIAEKSGWWNGINGRDCDHDGDIDYVVTNFGLNTKYHPDSNHSYRIYYSDFDRNGRMDVVEAKFAEDTLLPVRGFS